MDADKPKEPFRSKPFQFIEVKTDADGAHKWSFSLYKQPDPRSGHRTVCDDGNLYSYGGYQKAESLGIHPHKLFQELWCFNFAEARWKLLPTTGVPPKELASHCAILYGNYMLVFGGTGVNFGESTSNKLNACDLRSLVWDEVQVTGEPPTPQYGQAVVFDERRKCMYVIGGTTGFEFTMDIHKIDLATKAWELVYACKGDQAEPTARYRHEVAFDGKSIYVFGGGTSLIAFPLKTLPTFNLETRKWSMLRTKKNTGYTASSNRDQDVPAFPTRRKCHASVQMGNDVYICGGCNANVVYDDIWRFNIPRRQWYLLPVRMPIPLSFHTANLTPDGCMYLFGGVTDIVKGIRSNRVFKIWLKLPKLKDMCWEALLKSNTQISHSSHAELFDMGIPHDFVRRVHPSPPGGKPDSTVEHVWKSDLLSGRYAGDVTQTPQGCLTSFI